MKITPEIRAIRNDYMQARNENNQPEMNRLKSKAMAIKNASTDPNNSSAFQSQDTSKTTKSKDGDELILSDTQHKKSTSINKQ